MGVQVIIFVGFFFFATVFSFFTIKNFWITVHNTNRIWTNIVAMKKHCGRKYPTPFGHQKLVIVRPYSV